MYGLQRSAARISKESAILNQASIFPSNRHTVASTGLTDPREHRRMGIPPQFTQGSQPMDARGFEYATTATYLGDSRSQPGPSTKAYDVDSAQTSSSGRLSESSGGPSLTYAPLSIRTPSTSMDVSSTMVRPEEKEVHGSSQEAHSSNHPDVLARSMAFRFPLLTPARWPSSRGTVGEQGKTRAVPNAMAHEVLGGAGVQHFRADGETPILPPLFPLPNGLAEVLKHRAADRTTEGPGVDIRPIYDSLKEELGEIEGLAQSILQLRSQEEIMEKRERISGQSVRLPELALASDMDGAIARVKQLLQISLKERVSVRPR